MGAPTYDILPGLYRFPYEAHMIFYTLQSRFSSCACFMLALTSSGTLITYQIEQRNTIKTLNYIKFMDR